MKSAGMLLAAVGTSAYTQPAAYASPTLTVTSMRGLDAESTAAAGWSEVINKLWTFRGLDDDWDGEGTVAPGAVLVDQSIRLAQWMAQAGFEPAHWVHVGVNATIYFDWHHPSRVYAEVEVCSPARAEYRRISGGVLAEESVWELR